MKNTSPFTLGTDLVATTRFIEWIDYPHDKLRTLFTETECAAFKTRKQELNHSKIPSQRKDELLCQYLASRFAAKEAWYKALSWWLQQYDLTTHSFTIKTIAPLVGVEKVGDWQLPQLAIDEKEIENIIGTKIPPYRTALSLSHERGMAIAQVVMWKN